MANNATPKRPDYHAYVVTKKNGQDKGYWTRIGAAWRHDDGEGINLNLVALPVGNEIVLRTPREESDEA